MPAEEILGALEAVGAGSLIAAAGMIAWRILAQRAGRVRERHAAGGMLGTELTVIAEAIRDADWLRSAASASYEQRPVPRDVYVGLAGSARLADFDPPMREFLYRFYWRASLGDHAYMNRAMKEAIDGVEQFTAENAPGIMAALGRLKRHLARQRDRRGSGNAGKGGRREQGQGAPGAPIGGGGGTAPPADDAGREKGQGAPGAPIGGGGGTAPPADDAGREKGQGAPGAPIGGARKAGARSTQSVSSTTRTGTGADRAGARKAGARTSRRTGTGADRAGARKSGARTSRRTGTSSRTGAS